MLVSKVYVSSRHDIPGFRLDAIFYKNGKSVYGGEDGSLADRYGNYYDIPAITSALDFVQNSILVRSFDTPVDSDSVDFSIIGNSATQGTNITFVDNKGEEVCFPLPNSDSLLWSTRSTVTLPDTVAIPVKESSIPKLVIGGIIVAVIYLFVKDRK